MGPPGPPGPGGPAKPNCAAGPNGGGGGCGAKPKAKKRTEAPAVNIAPKTPPTSPAPITTPVEWLRFAAGATGADVGVTGASWVLVVGVVSSEVMRLLTSSVCG